MTQDDIIQSISDLQQSIDDTNQSIDDYTSSNDSNVSDMQTAIDDLNSTAGQLTFPLSQDTIDLIKQIYFTGFATLVAGTVTIANPNVSPTSNIFLSVATAGGTLGFISYVATTGQIVINSSSATDTSTISYVIFN